jgi:hypothetical protein
MKAAKIGTIFLVSIIALAGIGASYATWFDQTQIAVTSTTGTLSYQIDTITEYDQSPVGSNVVISAVPVVDYKHWQVTVTGAFPGWEGRVLITWHNTGSIPLTFDSFQVIINNDPAGLSPYYNLKFYYGAGWTLTNLDASLAYLSGYGPMTYAYLGIPPSAVTIAPGATGQSVVGLKLASTLTGGQNQPITFYIYHTVTQAI